METSQHIIKHAACLTCEGKYNVQRETLHSLGFLVKGIQSENLNFLIIPHSHW